MRIELFISQIIEKCRISDDDNIEICLLQLIHITPDALRLLAHWNENTANYSFTIYFLCTIGELEWGENIIYQPVISGIRLISFSSFDFIYSALAPRVMSQQEERAVEFNWSLTH